MAQVVLVLLLLLWIKCICHKSPHNGISYVNSPLCFACLSIYPTRSVMYSKASDLYLIFLLVSALLFLRVSRSLSCSASKLLPVRSSTDTFKSLKSKAEWSLFLPFLLNCFSPDAPSPRIFAPHSAIPFRKCGVWFLHFKSCFINVSTFPAKSGITLGEGLLHHRWIFEVVWVVPVLLGSFCKLLFYLVKPLWQIAAQNLNGSCWNLQGSQKSISIVNKLGVANSRRTEFSAKLYI